MFELDASIIQRKMIKFSIKWVWPWKSKKQNSSESHDLIILIKTLLQPPGGGSSYIKTGIL